ncbi:hypothetical protein D3C85_1739580 [compost metagenome]
MDAGIGEVVVRQITALDRSVIAIAKRDVRLRRQPRMVVDRWVPEVMMGIDDGTVPQFTHGAPRRD